MHTYIYYIDACLYICTGKGETNQLMCSGSPFAKSPGDIDSGPDAGSSFIENLRSGRTSDFEFGGREPAGLFWEVGDIFLGLWGENVVWNSPFLRDRSEKSKLLVGPDGLP